MNEQPEKKPIPLNFRAMQEDIRKAIQDKLKACPLPSEDAGFTLIEGFMSLPIRQEFSNEVFIGGRSVPIVGIVGNKSGRIYTFALKAILPSINL